MIESYENRLKRVTSSVQKGDTTTVKEEPIDNHTQVKSTTNHLLEMQIIKDHLEQSQIDLGFTFERKNIESFLLY